MKRAELTFKVNDKFATLVGYKNILSLKELEKVLSQEKIEYYLKGTFFYFVPMEGVMQDYVRVGSYPYSTTFRIGDKMSINAMESLIRDMRDAGDRLSKILHEKTVTVKI